MRVVAVPEYCMGCKLCEIFCAANHDGHKGNVQRTYKKGSPVPRSKIVTTAGSTWLNTCRQCDDSPCVSACITGAMHKNEQGIVLVDQNKCIGCYTCVTVCPNGHVQPGEARLKVVKCDLCADLDHSPSCVSNCPNGALKLVDI